jgi:esterase
MMTGLAPTGRIESSDVTLFFRHFGTPGATPILISHGANYYDSFDWIEVATALASGRDVVAWDSRGFGESSWSPSRDYSYDAIIGDITALLDNFGWGKVVMMGHSAGGSCAALFAARHPDRTAGLILVDHCPGQGGGARPSDHEEKIFPSLEAALAAMSRDKNVTKGSAAWARLEMICKPVAGGFRFPRDRYFANRTPIRSDGWTPQIVVTDPWLELAKVQAPILIVHGTRSDRYTAENLARVNREFPKIRLVAVDSGHDVAAGAPDALVAAVRQFLTTHIDPRQSART